MTSSLMPAVTTTIDPFTRQRLAEGFLGAIDWQDDSTGFLPCPAAHMHSTPSGKRDCKVFLRGSNGSGAVKIHCVHGSCVELVATASRNLASAISLAEKRKTIAPLARSPKTTQQPSAQKLEQRKCWPVFESPTEADLKAITRQRGLSLPGLTLAAVRGFLHTTETPHGRAWIVTDSERRNAQARRLDGQPWQHLGGVKAWTLPGSEASRPIGLNEAQALGKIALVEGGTDFLAACHLIDTYAMRESVAPVAMLGASHRIPSDCLPLFRGKLVRICADADTAGQRALNTWGGQLTGIAAGIDSYSFEGLSTVHGSPVKDLCDFVHICPEDWETERDRVIEVLKW